MFLRTNRTRTNAAAGLTGLLLGVAMAAMSACGEARRQGHEPTFAGTSAADMAGNVFTVQSRTIRNE